MNSHTPHQLPPVTTGLMPLTPVRPIQEAPSAWWKGGFETGSASACGSYHAENEDSYLLAYPNILAVADGVGGGAHGKIASSTLIGCIKRLTPALLSNAHALRQWLLNADTTVARAIAQQSDRAGASTFVAAAPFLGGLRWRLTWAGDCRAYRLKSGRLLQLTADDTYGNLNEPPPSGSEPDDPARMVGSGAVAAANQCSTWLTSGDMLVLCSDGVHKYVAATEIVTFLGTKESLETRCRTLANRAHANGGTDDATVVVIERRRWFGVSDYLWWILLLTLFGGALQLLLHSTNAITPATPPLKEIQSTHPESAPPLKPINSLRPEDFAMPSAASENPMSAQKPASQE